MRRLGLFLAVYGILLAGLFYFIPAKVFFFSVCVFFLCAVAIGLKGYRSSIENLIRDMDSYLDKKKKKKKALSEEIKKADNYISELRDRETVLVSLYEITKRMSLGLTFDEIFNALSVFLRENFIFRKSELVILKEEDGNIKVDKVYKEEKEEKVGAQEDRPDHSQTLKLFLKSRKEIYVPKENGSSFAAIPLLSENKFVGILTIEDLGRIDFDRFVIVAMQFSLEIKKVLLYETVEELAITDSLTGLYTRRYFFELLNEESNRSKRHNFKFTYLMIDIDDFKKCNDTYGHLVGDVVLRDVARIIKENTRQIDLVARYGGEEFSLILPETDRIGAHLAAERIRKRIEDNIFKAYDEKLKITVSIGLAVYPDDVEEAADLIEDADKALYAAKSSGKNIVCEYKS